MVAMMSYLLLALAGLLLLPAALLLTQVACAALPRSGSRPRLTPRPALAVLVPAHDESAGIERTLRSVREQLAPNDRLLVVADNCSDDTAGIAIAAGAEVVERHDLARRGKGYALDFGVRHLEQSPPQLVVIVDADCELASGTLDRIARTCAATGRPVQALYLMKAQVTSSDMWKIIEFAQVIKNFVRPLGYLRIGLPCQLMGTGMALPWPLIHSLGLASGHLAEDVKMGIDCAKAGRPPLFCPEALVTSHFPVNQEGAQSQRTRWEHGHLSVILEDAPKLFMEGLLGRSSGALALAVDLCVPPLALLGLAIAVTCGLGAIHYAVVGDPLPLLVALLGLAAMSAAILVAWIRFGRRILSLWQLARVPFYVLCKVPLYLRFLAARQVEWVRSRRDGT